MATSVKEAKNTVVEKPRRQMDGVGDPVFRPERACNYLDISKATLWRLVKSQKLPPPLKLSSQARGWRLSDLDTYLQAVER